MRNQLYNMPIQEQRSCSIKLAVPFLYRHTDTGVVELLILCSITTVRIAEEQINQKAQRCAVAE